MEAYSCAPMGANTTFTEQTWSAPTAVGAQVSEYKTGLVCETLLELSSVRYTGSGNTECTSELTQNTSCATNFFCFQK